MVSNAFGARLNPTRGEAPAMLYDRRKNLVRGEDVAGAASGARTTIPADTLIDHSRLQEG